MYYLDRERREAIRLDRPTWRTHCRICQRAVNLARRAPRVTYVEQIKLAAGCADCGIRSEHPEIYDFDHRPDQPKVNNISTLITKGTDEELDAEIAKCDIVCANCHRIRTRGRASLSFGVDKPRT